MSRSLVFFGALGLLACSAPTPIADEPLPMLLDPAAAPLFVGTHATLAVDVDPALQLHQVQGGEGGVSFARYDVARPTFRRGEGTFWMELVVRVPSGGATSPWVLAFGHPRPRNVVLHWVDETGAPRSSRGGLTLPAAQHDVPARSVVLRLPLPAAGERRFMVRADAFPLGFSATVLPEPALHEEEALEGAGLGLYYGGALGLIAFNLVLFALLRRRGYALYAALGLAQVLFFLGRNGWFWRLGLWTATPRHVGGLVASLHVMMLLLFTAEVLATRETSPRLHRLVRLGVGAALLNALVAAVGLGKVSDPVGIQLGLLSTVLVSVIAVRQALRRAPGALAYLTGHAAFLLGSLLYIAKVFGWIVHTPFTEHAMQVGSALNLVLSALALADHVRALDDRRRDLELLAAQRERELQQSRAQSLDRALAAQDAERQRIARDLHDGLGHLLLEMKLALDAFPAAPARLQVLAREGLQLLRAVSQALYPSELQTLGLAAALQAVAERTVADAGVHLSLGIGPLDELVAPEAQAAVLRAVQEALRNAITHGRPKHLSLEANREGDQVVIAVTDDGRGFEAGKVTEGSGLRNMRDRAQLAHGALILDSVPGEGTRVELRVPVARGQA